MRRVGRQREKRSYCKGNKIREGEGEGVGNICREIRMKSLILLRSHAHSSLVAVAVAVTDSLLRNSEIVVFISAIEDAKCAIIFSISSTLLDRSNIVPILLLLLLSVLLFVFDGISFPLSLT